MFSQACVIKAETPAQNPPGADTPINAGPSTSFVNCFFKNRYAEEDLHILGERCLPAGVETDWAAIRECLVEDNAVNDYFGKVTADNVANDIKADGLVVRINNAVNINAKTNLVGEICKAIPVMSI